MNDFENLLANEGVKQFVRTELINELKAIPHKKYTSKEVDEIVYKINHNLITKFCAIARPETDRLFKKMSEVMEQEKIKKD